MIEEPKVKIPVILKLILVSYISMKPEKVFCHIQNFRKISLCIKCWIYFLMLTADSFKADEEGWTLLPLA